MAMEPLQSDSDGPLPYAVADDESVVSLDDQPDEPESAEPQTAGREKVEFNIYLVCLAAFLSECGFTILIPSMWPRLDHMGRTKTFLGFVLALYCGGQFVGSLIMGSWTKCMRFRSVFLISLVLEFTGFLAYTLVPTEPKAGYVDIIILSRVISGLGGGNSAVSRGYVTIATSEASRARAFALLGGSMAMGWIGGPALGALCSLADFHFFTLHIDEYTAPSLFCAFMSCVSFLLMIMFLEEPWAVYQRIPERLKSPRDAAHIMQMESGGPSALDVPEDTDEPLGASLSKDPAADHDLHMNADSKDATVLDVGNWEDDNTMEGLVQGRSRMTRHAGCARWKDSRFVALVTCNALYFIYYSVLSLAETVMVPISKDDFGWGVGENGLLLACIGLVSVGMLFLVDWLNKRYTERSLILAGAIVQVMGCALIADWDGNLSIFRFSLGFTLLVGIGFSLVQPMLPSMYTKSVGSYVTPGVLMAVSTSVGALARMSGPIMSTQMLEAFGHLTLFVVVGVYVALSAVAVLLLKNTLRPLSETDENHGEKAPVALEDRSKKRKAKTAAGIDSLTESLL